jgi:hypothetical protein
MATLKRIIKGILHRIICAYCGRDIDEIGQDNMSSTIGRPMCEDCYNSGR